MNGDQPGTGSVGPLLGRLRLGCDYNPEQWDRATWIEDMRLMAQAGVDLVAVNVFGWARLQPRRGPIDFTDLDAVLDLLFEAGIGVNLGTGTASPPPWLLTAHPDMRPVTADGVRLHGASRQTWCPSSRAYLDHALVLTEAVARRYGRHPAVELWHVSNELGCHNARCHCDLCAVGFRTWLRARHGTLEALNAAWGTAFWSQRYDAWEEIDPPRTSTATVNPALQLDYRRFTSDALLAVHQAEERILRQHSDRPVTTNFMVTSHIDGLDYWRWAPSVDVVAVDHYLDHRLPQPSAELSWAADVTRGLAGGRPWILMEQAAGAVNWQPHNIAKHPGQMLRDSLVHVGRGADAVCFFQWRASLRGSEKFHSALLPHAGTDSRRWREVLELGRVVRALGDIAGTRVETRVAMLFAWESWWASDLDSHPSIEARHLTVSQACHAALRTLGLAVDVVRPGADLTGYDLLVVPALYSVDAVTAQSVRDYVDAGGHTLVTFFSGIVDEHDAIAPGGYPAAFRDVLGLHGEESHPLLPGQVLHLDDGTPVTTWTDLVQPRGADVLARYAEGPLAGEAAVLSHRFGEGRATYLGTWPEHDGLVRLLSSVCEAAGIVVPALGTLQEPLNGDELEVLTRVGQGREYVVLANHTDRELRHDLTRGLAHRGPREEGMAARELITDEPVVDVVSVPARSARVVERRADRQGQGRPR